MKKEYQKFYGLENAYIVKVVEGNGTEESVAREVLYVFSEDLVVLGKKDAIKSGKLKRLPCEVCGNIKSQMHHPDYSKPLKVRWLCPKYHGEIRWISQKRISLLTKRR